MPKVYIIILNFNGWTDTEECLRSLGKVEYDNFEIILIDNGSRGDYRLRITDYCLKMEVIYNKENLGFAGGNNKGIEIALERGAEYILLLNNDTTVEPRFLAKLIETAERNKDAGILGPMTYFYDSRADEYKTICSAGGRIIKNAIAGTLIGYKEIDKGQYNKQKVVDYISGACLLIKRELINKIGLISEDYFLYYEDGDWCLHARRVGYKCIFIPESVIYHKVSRSAQEFSYPYIYYHSRNGMMFSWRFGFKPLTLLQGIWIVLKQIIKIIIGYKRNWAFPVMRGVMDFWRGKMGKLEEYY